MQKDPQNYNTIYWRTKGQKLERERRWKLGLKQYEVLDALGCTYNTYYRRLRGITPWSADEKKVLKSIGFSEKYM